jgi:hypothetical protein
MTGTTDDVPTGTDEPTTTTTTTTTTNAPPSGKIKPSSADVPTVPTVPSTELQSGETTKAKQIMYHQQ